MTKTLLILAILSLECWAFGSPGLWKTSEGNSVVVNPPFVVDNPQNNVMVVKLNTGETIKATSVMDLEQDLLAAALSADGILYLHTFSALSGQSLQELYISRYLQHPLDPALLRIGGRNTRLISEALYRGEYRYGIDALTQHCDIAVADGNLYLLVATAGKGTLFEVGLEGFFSSGESDIVQHPKKELVWKFRRFQFDDLNLKRVTIAKIEGDRCFVVINDKLGLIDFPTRWEHPHDLIQDLFPSLPNGLEAPWIELHDIPAPMPSLFSSENAFDVQAGLVYMNGDRNNPVDIESLLPHGELARDRKRNPPPVPQVWKGVVTHRATIKNEGLEIFIQSPDGETTRTLSPGDRFLAVGSGGHHSLTHELGTSEIAQDLQLASLPAGALFLNKEVQSNSSSGQTLGGIPLSSVRNPERRKFLLGQPTAYLNSLTASPDSLHYDLAIDSYRTTHLFILTPDGELAIFTSRSSNIFSLSSVNRGRGWTVQRIQTPWKNVNHFLIANLMGDMSRPYGVLVDGTLYSMKPMSEPTPAGDTIGWTPAEIVRIGSLNLGSEIVVDPYSGTISVDNMSGSLNVGNLIHGARRP